MWRPGFMKRRPAGPAGEETDPLAGPSGRDRASSSEHAPRGEGSTEASRPRWAVAGQAGVLAFGALDLFGSRAELLARGAVATVAVALAGGALLGWGVGALGHAWGGTAIRRAAGGPGAWVGAGAAAIVVAGGAGGALLFAVHAFHRPSLVALAAALVTGAILGVGVAVFGVVRRLASWPARALRFRWIPVAVGALLGLAATLALSARPETHWIWTRAAASGLAAWAVAAAVARALRARRVHARWPALGALAGSLIALAPLGPLPGSVLLPAATAAIRPFTDFDGDGGTSCLGGDDCAPFDGARSGDGVEVAGNGVDEDCRFGDLAPEIPRPAALERGAAGPVALVTVAGLSRSHGRLRPGLPALERRLAGARRFTNPVPLEGALRHVAAVLLAGAVRTEPHPRDSGFPAGGPTLPGLLERSGGQAYAAVSEAADLDELAPLFLPERQRTPKEPARVAAEAAGFLRKAGRRSFTWVHLEPARAADLDAALETVLAAAGGASHRVVLVGLGPGGGPIAAFGAGIEAGEVAAPVGFFDVYPTLVELLGLEGAVATGAPRAMSAGTSLRPVLEGPLTGLDGRDGAVGGRVGGPWQAHGAAGAVEYDGRSGQFRLPGGRRIAHDAPASEAGEAAAVVTRLRDGLLAPQLAERQRARAEGRSGTPPGPLEGTPAEIGGALRLLGCRLERLADAQVAVTVYLRGGEHLDPDDLLDLWLGSGHRGRTRWRGVPLDGALPFGTWRSGETIAQRVVFDTRPLSRDTVTVWAGVQRATGFVPPTGGAGNIGPHASICNFPL